MVGFCMAPGCSNDARNTIGKADKLEAVEKHVTREWKVYNKNLYAVIIYCLLCHLLSHLTSKKDLLGSYELTIFLN